jgi:hypothetical protein
MKDLLISQINAAQTKADLEDVVNNIPKQDNGEKPQIARVLDDSFWYTDFNLTLDEHKEWMIKRVLAYA